MASLRRWGSGIPCRDGLCVASGGVSSVTVAQTVRSGVPTGRAPIDRSRLASYLGRMRTRPPRIAALDLPSPLDALRSLAHLPYPFLLHSSAPGGRARWSFFGADPFAVFGPADYDEARRAWRSFAAPRAAGAPELPELDGVPFTGGAVGYWAYDFGRRLERLPAVATDDLRLPDVLLGLYDVVGAYHHERQRGYAISTGLPLSGEAGAARAEERLREFVDSLSAP